MTPTMPPMTDFCTIEGFHTARPATWPRSALVDLTNCITLQLFDPISEIQGGPKCFKLVAIFMSGL
jgi:hypothetical protein